jgi:hypothetical protein
MRTRCHGRTELVREKCRAAMRKIEDARWAATHELRRESDGQRK